ncbi:MAG: hypothetical protein ACHQPH_24530 [Reyranellales bacterium]
MRMMAFMMALLLGAAAAAAAGAAEPVPTPKMIFFATGSTRGTAGGHVLRGSRNLYSVKAGAGQVMTVTITAPDDNAVFQIYEPGAQIGRDADGLLQFTGKALAHADDGDDATRWSGRLPRTGTYLIVIGSTRGDARYSMDVKIE